MTVYFDNAATTKVCPEAAEAVLAAMTEDYGNPSSGYKLGRNAAAKLKTAREQVASALGAKPEEVYFTSGGTEGDNWAIRASAHLMRHRGHHIITGASEHDAVRKTMQSLEQDGWEVTYIAPDKSGRTPVEAVLDAVRDDTVLVSVMMVNNETGAVNDIAAMAAGVRTRNPGALFHTDAVQGFLKVPFSAKKLGADLITISSHKIHGPKGSGALYVRSGLRLSGMMTGGEQEGGLRPGTEATPAILGFGAAAQVGKKCFNESTEHMRELREYTLTLLREALPVVETIGDGEAPHILSISLPGYKSEVLMNFMDAAGVCVSKSSACKKGARSHVLEAMKLPNDVIDGAIRVSFSRYSTREEAEYFVKTLADAAARLKTAK